MAWENLAEELEEEFSDNRRLGWVPSGFSFIRRTGRAAACPQAARTRQDRANASRRSQRQNARLAWLVNGERATQCAGKDCCNLLPLIPLGGCHQRYCSKGCRERPKQVRLKRAQRARRRAAKYASGEWPTRCTGPGCDRPLSPIKTKRPLYCSEKCGARARRLQRKGGTAGASGVRSTGADGASGLHE